MNSTPVYVYILECKNGSLYTGITSNLRRRLYEHNHRIRSSLQKVKMPVKLVYFEKYNSREEAAFIEKKIKGWSRVKKLALIKNQCNQMKSLH